jgi:hypothetical protein
MKILEELLAWLNSIGHETLNFVEGLAKTISKNGGPVLIAAAQAEVAAAEAAAVATLAAGGTKKTGEEKFKEAQAAIIAALTAKGIPIVINAINGAIESAVADLPVAGA